MARLPDGTLIGGIVFETADIIGAGGWCTGGAAADDGTMITRIDVASPRIRGPLDVKWRRLFKPGINIAASEVNQSNTAQGTYDVAICATDSSAGYFVVGGALYRFEDDGDTVVLTSIEGYRSVTPSNESSRMTGQPLAVDPENKDVVILGTPSGVFYSDDGGATNSTISDLPPASVVQSLPVTGVGAGLSSGDIIVGATSGRTATVLNNASGGATSLTVYNATGSFTVGENLQVGGATKAVANGALGNTYRARYIIAFDRNSSVVGGKTQGIYAFITKAGSGLYHSTDGGATWANIPGGPSIGGHMQVSEHDGYVHIAGNYSGGSSQYRRYDGSSWIAPSGISSKSIAVSPHNAGHIYLASAGGNLRVSTDNGVSFSAAGGNARVATTIPWHEWCSEDYMSNGNIVFDRSTNRLWCFEGIGAWTLDDPPTTISSSNDIVWTERSAGIENMVTTLMSVSANGSMLYTCHDRQGFVIPKDEIGRVYPSIHMGTQNTSIRHGGTIDDAPEDSDFLVACRYGAGGFYSENNGASWLPFDNDGSIFPDQDVTITVGSPCAITWPGGAPTEGMPFQFNSSTGLPSGLSSSTWYFARNCSGDTSNLSASKTGSLLDASGTAAGPHSVSSSLGGGNIIALSSSVFIVRPTSHGPVKWTKDGGATWYHLEVGTGNVFSGHPAYYSAHKVLVKDRHVANQAYVYMVQDTGSSNPDVIATRGIWRINYDPIEEEMNMVRVFNGAIISYVADYWHGQLSQVGADDWLWQGADNALGLWRSRDGMASWQEVTGTDDVNGTAKFGEVYSVAIGVGRTVGEIAIMACGYRAASPTTEPTDYTTFGYWLSLGSAETVGDTWTRIDQFPDGIYTPGTAAGADPSEFGTFYFGIASEGAFKYRYKDRRAWS